MRKLILFAFIGTIGACTLATPSAEARPAFNMEPSSDGLEVPFDRKAIEILIDRGAVELRPAFRPT